MKDFDGGQIGQALSQCTLSGIHRQERLSWLVVDVPEFPNGPSDVQKALLDDRCWVAVTVNPGITNNLLAAICSSDASYNTSQAVSAYLTEARDQDDVHIPHLHLANVANCPHKYRYCFRETTSLSTGPLPALMNTPPLLVTRPLSYAMYELRPFNVLVYVSVVTRLGNGADVLIRGIYCRFCRDYIPLDSRGKP
ncbi:hypothetical protein BS17DRAFT_455188 [Gyrodon lividus]|nr:hypothetical protein BS17DRAFT_455188 [Gyrodon lividus]